MSDHHSQLAMLLAQLAGLGGLFWYVIETRRLRNASQEQVRISQNLINAAMDQVEGLSKPCLTLWSDLRDQRDAIAEMHGAIGSTKARGDQGDFVVQNIGNGVALNINYQFVAIPPTEDKRNHHPRYIQNLLAGKSMTMIEPMPAYQGNWKLTLRYESIGARKYQTVVTLNNHVLIGFTFEENMVPDLGTKGSENKRDKGI